jgi:putative copper resistance protein D
MIGAGTGHALYLLSVYLHIVAAIFWLGGMLFLAVVALPAVRQLDNPAARARLLMVVGRRFRNYGWLAIGVLLITGVGNTLGRWGLGVLGSGAFWSSATGRIFTAKLVLVAGMIVLSAVHDFALGPRLTALGRAVPADPRLAELRRQTVRLARLELGLGLAVVALAVVMVRGPG